MKIIKLSATWCSPCKAFAPKFEKAKSMPEFTNIEFVEMDIEEDESIETVEKYQIKSVPTILILNDDGEVNKKILGNISETEFIELIRSSIKPIN